MEYENYIKGLIKRADLTQEVLKNWIEKGSDNFTNEDISFLGEVNRLIGYCLGLDGIVNKEKEKET